jgi:hypothetical protein
MIQFAIGCGADYDDDDDDDAMHVDDHETVHHHIIPFCPFS